MQHEILYRDAFPIIRCRLSRGEQIKAEADAMINYQIGRASCRERV